MSEYTLTHLKQLEAESIHIIREVAAEFDKPVMLYSIGKDSSVMLHLALKAFYPGMRDPDIEWLRKSLTEIQGNPIDPMNSDYFDENLEARVRDYQIAKRLDVDGKVGQQTQIVINTDLQAGSPRLVRAN